MLDGGRPQARFWLIRARDASGPGGVGTRVVSSQAGTASRFTFPVVCPSQQPLRRRTIATRYARRSLSIPLTSH